MKVRLELTKDYLEVLPSISIYRQRMGTYWRLRLSFAWIIFSLNFYMKWK
jgi:hypothetical protein